MDLTFRRALGIFAIALSSSAGAAEVQVAEQGAGGTKSTIISAAATRASLLRLEVNLRSQGTIAVEAGVLGSRESSDRQADVAETPDSLTTWGREVKVMVSRYSQGSRMGGFFWGLGVGQRVLQADWRKSPYYKTVDQFGIVDSDGKVTHRVTATGTLLEGRLGYRYVTSDLGFLAGLFLDVAHHNAHVRDREVPEDSDPAADHVAPIGEHDAYVLGRRLGSTGSPGFEIGWAF